MVMAIPPLVAIALLAFSIHPAIGAAFTAFFVVVYARWITYKPSGKEGSGDFLGGI
jgi:hypothetical protein